MHAAPDFTAEARSSFQSVLTCASLSFPKAAQSQLCTNTASVAACSSRLLTPSVVDTSDWKVVTKTQLQDGWMEELKFAMYATATLKSNAIAIARGRQLLGAGAGQMSRVDACEQAIKKVRGRHKGSFLGSDAFFPFDDCVRLAGEAGVVLDSPAGRLEAR